MGLEASSVDALERDPDKAPLGPRSRALVDYALKLTRAPSSVREADIDALRLGGLNDRAIHDAASIAAYFNYVNRLASGLGVELEESYGNKA